MDKKQTAVQWLEQNMPNISKHIPIGIALEFLAKFQKAKEIERQQIEEAFVAGDERGTNNIPFNAEQYFNQTYQ